MSSRRKILLIILVLALTVFIFSNSMKGSEASTQDSDFFIRLIESIFGESDLDLHFLVRKGAHMAEFALLGLLVSFFVFSFDQIAHHLGYGLFYVLSVAVIDEFIQNFTGRSSMVQDVLIDFTGAMLGIGLALMVRFFKCKKADKIAQNAVD